MDCPSKLKLNTITDVFSGDPEFLSKVSSELAVLATSFKKRNLNPLGSSTLLWLETASPSCRTSWSGMIRDVLALRGHGLLPHLEFFVLNYGSYNFKRLYKTILKLLDCISYNLICDMSPTKDDYDGNVGQLSAKKEAAGKVRIFAIVDV